MAREDKLTLRELIEKARESANIDGEPVEINVSARRSQGSGGIDIIAKYTFGKYSASEQLATYDHGERIEETPEEQARAYLRSFSEINEFQGNFWVNPGDKR